MYVARAAALANNGFAFFVLPPDGPSRPGRQQGSASAARRFLRTVRAELARAADESPTVLPRITNYPY
jgi:hypothetical protein